MPISPASTRSRVVRGGEARELATPRAAPFDAYDPSARVFTLGENEPGGWDILRQLWRRKLLITGVTILMAGVGIAAVTLMSPRYTAEARVLLGVQDRKVTNVQSVLEGLVPNDSNIRSEAFLISSRSMARQVDEVSADICVLTIGTSVG